MTQTDTRKSFLLFIPVFQSVYGVPFRNFMAMMSSAASREHARYSFTLFVPTRELLHKAANRAGELVLANGYDGLIMFDDDCLPPIDAISRVLRRFEEGHPIVSGLGFMRNPPWTTTVGRYYPEGVSLARDRVSGQVQLTGFEWLDDIQDEPDDLVPCDFCGFPIALVSADALRAMTGPWFGTNIDGGECTHDVFFGHRAKQAGLPIVVDRTLVCGHLTDGEIITIHNRALARQAYFTIQATQVAAQQAEKKAAAEKAATGV